MTTFPRFSIIRGVVYMVYGTSLPPWYMVHLIPPGEHRSGVFRRAHQVPQQDGRQGGTDGQKRKADCALNTMGQLRRSQGLFHKLHSANKDP